MLISSGKKRDTNWLKKWIWEGLGLYLGGVWDALGSLLGASWPALGPSKWSFFKTLVQDKLQEATWIDFGSILEGFGEGFGRSWEDFAQFWKGLGPSKNGRDNLWHKLGTGRASWVGTLCYISLLGTFSILGPPRCSASPREASQCAGVLLPACWTLFQLTQALGLSWAGLRPPERPSRIPSRVLTFSLWGSFFAIFRLFFASLAHLKPS